MGEIDYDKIMSELDNLSSDGFTANEMAQAINRTPAISRQKLRALVEKGIVYYVGDRRITRIDGRPGVVPVYAATAPAREKVKT